MSSAENFLEIQNVKTHFPVEKGFLFRRRLGEVKAVDGVSLTLRQGEILGLVGESGCGKSTLGRTILQLVRPTAGEITLAGQSLTALRGAALREARPAFQMVFQDPYASLNPRMTVFDTLAEAMQAHASVPRRELPERVETLLRKVGLSPAAWRKYPHEFSGGQRQRIAIARALAVEPKLLVADEPVSALDVSIQAQIINLLARLCREMGLTLLFISHDLSVVKHIADRIAVMYLGRIVEIGPAADVIEKPLHPYTKALISAVPIPDPRREARRARVLLPGDPPSPLHPPGGCPFHPRCLYAIEQCAQTVPALEPFGRPERQASCIRLKEINAPSPALPLSRDGQHVRLAGVKVFVTGGAGYIGSVCVEELLNAGHEVTVYDDLTEGHRSAVDSRAKFILARAGKDDNLAASVRDAKPDAVVHFAAFALVGESMLNPSKYFRNNVSRGLELLDATVAAGVKKFVFSSTCATYGPPDRIPMTEDLPQRPINPYGESKLMFEKLLQWYQQIHGLEFVAFRYFNAAGAGQKFGEHHRVETHLIPNILQVPLGRASECQIFGTDYPTPDGTCIRDYIHIVDLAQAHMLAMQPGRQGFYNLGNGDGYSVRQVIKMCEKVTGHAIATVEKPRRPGDPPRLVASAAKAISELGWKPKYPGLEQIISDAWRWHKAHPDGYPD